MNHEMSAPTKGTTVTCDVLVAGTGAGGLVGALTLARGGLDVLLVEKTAYVGGTTALSGGGIWLPNNPVSDTALDDDPEQVRRYLDAVIGDGGDAELRDAFLTSAPAVLGALGDGSEPAFEWRPFPDYFPELPGARPEGRAVFPLDVTAAEVGPEVAALVRPPLPESRGGHDTGDVLAGGRALVARLLRALAGTDTTLWTDAGLATLALTDGRVTAATIDHGGIARSVEVRAGVLLATGGFEHDLETRHRHGHPVQAGWTMGAPGATGGALKAAVAIGADTDLLDACWWTPAFPTADGPAFRVRDRGRPGSIVVDQDGRRFANESLPYDRIGNEMARLSREGQLDLPCWFIIDQQFVDRYGINGVAPGGVIPEGWFDGGFAHRAETLAGLADVIGVPADSLAATVARTNRFAAIGVDDDFGRGDSAFDQFFGDAEVTPNPCLAPLEVSPYYALPVILSDLGTKGGLRCGPSGQVLDDHGRSIGGLYATGNTMAAWSGSTYPGPGVPIGTSMVFGYRAARDLIGGPNDDTSKDGA